MRRVLLLAACAALACGQTSQERGRRVVMEAVEALGGERFLAMKDRTETGRAYSFYRDEVSGLSRAVIYTRYLPAPPADGVAAVEER